MFICLRTIVIIALMTGSMAAYGTDILPVTNTTAKARVSPTFSPTLFAVLATDGKHDYQPRVNAVHALGQDLSAEEIKALYALLNRRAGEDPMPLDQLNAIKNDVLTALQKQTTPPANLTRNLAAMYNNPKNDVVWRDYCIQHLGEWYSSITNAQEQAMARNVIWSAAATKGGTIPGTALIALCNLAGRPGLDKNRIAARALAVALDESCGEPSRMTALQICARLGDRQVLPEARKLVDSSASVLIRVSAIACIGTLGDVTDKLLLEQQAASTDRRLRVAAESALKRLGSGAQ